jgi:hypothetical protein
LLGTQLEVGQNPLPVIVPCHRVVAAAGGLGGYSAPQGVSLKQRLLEMERERRQLFKRYVRSERHTLEIDFDRYLYELARERRAGERRAEPSH